MPVTELVIGISDSWGVKIPEKFGYIRINWYFCVKQERNMKNLKFDIVNIEEFSGQKAQIYSIMFEGDKR